MQVGEIDIGIPPKSQMVQNLACYSSSPESQPLLVSCDKRWHSIAYVDDRLASHKPRHGGKAQ